MVGQKNISGLQSCSRPFMFSHCNHALCPIQIGASVPHGYLGRTPAGICRCPSDKPRLEGRRPAGAPRPCRIHRWQRDATAGVNSHAHSRFLVLFGFFFPGRPFYGTVLAFAFPTEKQSGDTNRILISLSSLPLGKPTERTRALAEGSAEPASLVKSHSSS